MQLDKEMGTRHRAAVGVSEETDSFTVVVSEETGIVSITRNGEIIREISKERLEKELCGLRNVSEKKRKFPFKKRREQV